MQDLKLLKINFLKTRTVLFAEMARRSKLIEAD